MTVLARGEGPMADRILEIARREGIPIHEDAGLVDILSRLDVEREIPPELYRVVAEIIAFVFRVQAAAAARAPAPAYRLGSKSSRSQTFFTTVIFAAGVPRAANVFRQISLTVTTRSAKPVEIRSIARSTRIGNASASSRRIDAYSSGIGSCMSRTSFAPRSFGTSHSKPT